MLGNYLDKLEPKVRSFSCERICVEFNLEQGLLKEINVTKYGCTCFQKLDYDQFPLKCNIFHEYGNFAKGYKK